MRSAQALLVGLLALLAITIAVWRLEGAKQGLEIRTQRVGTTPVTVFRPAGGASSPVVLVAHGFAGSQQLMQPFAVTLARNGYTAVTFDFPGHGRNGAPLRGGLADQDESLRTLVASMRDMGCVRTQPGRCAGRALRGDRALDGVGHRRAPRAGRAAGAGHGRRVACSRRTLKPGTPADSPRNLLVIDGALEPQMMATEALRVVGLVAGPGAAPATTYGSFVDGTARRATLSPGGRAHRRALQPGHAGREPGLARCRVRPDRRRPSPSSMPASLGWRC